MKDGNKEATKELIGTFRLIFTASTSIVLLATNFAFRGQLIAKNVPMFVIALVLLVVACLLSLVLFLLTVPKLYREENAIPYQRSIVLTGCTALVAFLAGIAAIIGSQV